MERVTVAQLKSRLSHYLREVRSGRSFTVVSRDIPVATLAPHAAADDGLASIPPDPAAPALSAPVLGRAAGAPDAVELIRDGRGGTRRLTGRVRRHRERTRRRERRVRVIAYVDTRLAGVAAAFGFDVIGV